MLDALGLSMDALEAVHSRNAARFFKLSEPGVVIASVTFRA